MADKDRDRGRDRDDNKDKAKTGFGAMDPARLKEISSKGGIAVHKSGNAYRWTKKQAKEAGRKGGQVSRGGRVGVLGPKIKAEGTGEAGK